MTNDIVERLRDPFYTPSLASHKSAADEIERLRRMLTDVVDAWDWWQVDTYDRCASVPADAIAAARAALVGEKTND